MIDTISLKASSSGCGCGIRTLLPLNPIAHIQKTPSATTARGIILGTCINGGANIDGAGVDASGGGFVSFGEAVGFAGLEVGCVMVGDWACHFRLLFFVVCLFVCLFVRLLFIKK